MCEACPDPRDAVLEATGALVGLMRLANTSDEPIEPHHLAKMLSIICDRLEPASEKLLEYKPADF